MANTREREREIRADRGMKRRPWVRFTTGVKIFFVGPSIRLDEQQGDRRERRGEGSMYDARFPSHALDAFLFPSKDITGRFNIQHYFFKAFSGLFALPAP